MNLLTRPQAAPPCLRLLLAPWRTFRSQGLWMALSSVPFGPQGHSFQPIWRNNSPTPNNLGHLQWVCQIKSRVPS